MLRKFPTDRLLTSALLLAALGACRQDMHDQLKMEPLEETTLFEDGRASRHPPKGTIPRGHLKSDRHLHYGREALTTPTDGPDDGSTGELVNALPYPVTKPMLERGQERYNIYCAPCHAQTGNGDGMIVRRGFSKPPSLHDDKVKNAKLGHLYDVIRRGIGSMPAYATQIPVNDRWAIVAYIRALQLSKSAKLDDVPAAQRPNLSAGPSVKPPTPPEASP